MHPEHAERYVSIRDFEIDEDQPAFPFAARLACENGWTRSFADRVIVEYKRFVFLAMTAGHPVTPSALVDESWHLHLTFTRSYWQRLCGGVLGKPLHHEPTKGGSAEASKFREQYERTLNDYRLAFGEEPPRDIWPASDVRFGDESHAVRVNPHHSWIVPKAWAKRASILAAAIVFLIAALGCGIAPDAEISPENALRCFPFAFAAALFIGWRVREWLRSPGGEPERELVWEEQISLFAERHKSNAFRLLTATLTRLVSNGVAKISADGECLEAAGAEHVQLSRPEAAARSALPISRSDKARLTEIAERVAGEFAVVRDRLQDDGYLLSEGRRSAIGTATMSATLLAFAVLYLPMLAMTPNSNFVFGFLCICVPMLGIPSLVIGFISLNRLTRRGKLVRSRLRREAWNERRGTSDPSAAVAEFGTSILNPGAQSGLCAWFPQKTSAAFSGCGGGCGAGCGGGGCGGGGCGG